MGLKQEQLQDIYGLSPLQKGILFHAIKEDQSSVYVEQFTYHLKGTIDGFVLEESLNDLFIKYDVLRTLFLYENLSEPLQVVLTERKCKLHYQNLSRFESSEQQSRLEQFCIQDRRRGFDLSRDVLIRFALFYLGEDQYRLVCSFHHILLDGWCMGLLLRDLMQFYQQRIEQQPVCVTPAPSYSKYINWLDEQDLSKAQSYWQKRLSDCTRPTGMPAPGYQGEKMERAVYSFSIDETITAQLKRLAKEHKVTLNHLCQAIWALLLHRYHDTNEIVFGTIVSGRPAAIRQVEEMVGLFIQPIPFHITINPADDFSAFLKNVRRTALEAEPYQYLSLADMGASALVDHLFAFENYPVDESTIRKLEQQLGISITDVEVYEQTHYPFTVQLMPGKELFFKFTYDASRYSGNFIARLEGHIRHLFGQVLTYPKRAIRDFALITEVEQERLLQMGRGEQLAIKDETLVQSWERQVMQTPTATALVEQDRKWSYRELNQQANQLAHFLRQKGVKKGTVVALLMKRSLETVMGIIGVLKAGGTYLPLEVDYPEDRIAYMLENSKTAFLLHDQVAKIQVDFAGEQIQIDDPQIRKQMKENPDFSCLANDLAYIIYTSGSTGRPKGVMVEHQAVLNLVEWHRKMYQVTADDQTTQLASIGFDAAVWELFPYLLSGSTVHIISNELRMDLDALNHYFERVGITISFMPTPLAERYMELENHSLRALLVGGDQLKQLKKTRYSVYNNYGPTENTVVSSSCLVHASKRPLSIGCPVANQRHYVLDQAGRLQPIGIAGELYVGGKSLARGYIHDPEQTASSFVINPFIPSERLYRTGDQVRWLENGELSFMGRLDDQVSIRGYRVELGEIEAQLLAHPAVEAAVVLEMNERLIAFVIADPSQTDALRTYLANRLPDYMVPDRITQLDQFPLTAHGKVDKQSLLGLTENIASERSYVPPQDELEETLVQIWTDVLATPHLGMDDSFFQMGGHSLKAIICLAQIHKHLHVKVPLAEFFARPTVRELAQYIRLLKKEMYRKIEPTTNVSYYPVTSAQKRLYVIQSFSDAGTSYNMPIVLRWDGQVDPIQIESAWRTLLNRHEILRTSFQMVDGELKQIVHDQVLLNFQQIQADQEELDKQIASLIQPIDLQQAPLWRVRLIHLPQSAILFVDLHHILLDGMSVNLLLQEFATLLRDEALSSVSLHYKDFAVWQQQAEESEHWQHDRQYWLQQFTEQPPVLELSTDFPRPPIQSFVGDYYTFKLEKEWAEQLKQLALQEQTTPYAILLSIYFLLLHKYTAQDDFVVGLPHAGRTHADIERMMGLFVNTLAIRCQFDANLSFRQLLDQVKRNLVAAHQHADFPLEELIEQLQIRRDMSRQPLFDTIFSMQNIDLKMPELPHANLTPYEYGRKTARFDLSWVVHDDEQLEISIEYCSKLFKRETIKRMGAHYLHLLQQVITQPNRSIAELVIVTPSEKNELLDTFHRVVVDYADVKTLSEYWEEQVLQTPEAIAIVDQERWMTYQELNGRVNQLAHRLRKEGVKPGAIVGLLTERSLEMVLGILAIIKAGGAYLPIEPTYPLERINYMLAHSRISLLLTQSTLHLAISYQGQQLFLDDQSLDQEADHNPIFVNHPHDLAYVIYTSGSTGQPKGVMVEHRAVLNLVQWHRRYYQVTTTDRATQLASGGFDAAVWELFPYLLSGATVHIIPDAIRTDLVALNRYFEQRGITISFLPTPLAERFMELENHSLRALLTGGDQLRQVKPQRYTIYNNYGPTENTVVTTCFPIDPAQGKLLIGSPIDNQRLYVLDEAQRLQPIGIPGELYIGGVSLARGYLHDEEQTNKHFIDDPFMPGQRIYRTGDRVRWLANGQLEYLGRVDDQVSIRGYRVELAEIEAQLLAHEEVEEAIVTVQQAKEITSTCAYVVGSTLETSDLAELRAYLSTRLPDYMIPTHMVRLDSLPLTPNGKIDKRALPRPEEVQSVRTQYRIPTNENERLLLPIWQEVLGRSELGIDDNFFEHGGDSIKAIQIIARLQQFDRTLEMKSLFTSPTIAELAPLVQPLKAVAEQGLVTGDVALTPIQRWFFSQPFAQRDHYNQTMFLYRSQRWQQDALRKALEKLVEHHDALRMTYQIENDGVTQYNRGLVGKLFHLETIDLRQEANVRQRVKKEAERMQGQLSLEQGPLMQCGHFQLAEGDHLLFIIHHLVVDGVSWRILIDDFSLAYHQAVQGEMIQLPPKTDAYQRWSQSLFTYANDPKHQSEWKYWKEIEEKMESIQQLSAYSRPSQSSAMEMISFSLSVDETQRLLTQSHHAYGTKIDDLLLTALVRSFHHWKGNEHLCLLLEGHGRESALEGVDISRTVGWFTSIFPLILKGDQSEDGALIKQIKEQLRQIPQKGFGYGVYKYLSAQGDGKIAQPEVSFNYLGQFSSSHVSLSSLPAGTSISPKATALSPLEITSLVEENKFHLVLRYDRHRYQVDEITRFMSNYRQQLLRMVEHCISQDNREFTPSDFTAHDDLTMDELEDVFGELEQG
ncbi:non-ribosomal peptide synthase domain TIGR01720/amino acid adenylation domain-containing protein [Seinonella peptonophila]|uniref:Non-ribosomal peptide synthase domain TIGR01720/amino acid adenylation domain-containing protein n=1 Tax=Seinonella peptonophila TaxID=112248 RepID=A0A1M4VID1_9BACL|nr:non-ribosomal peptide synthetase [Seinonella peptonophila]SHE68728.1 non-ribosomal peptide synthase domain TIGR01720/amino acid adenylation domain-containing protein [Seinonella peptonophila]